METDNSPSFEGFDGGGYDGFDFSQAELELTGSSFGYSLTDDTFPESWTSGESDEFFPDTFPENWVTRELPPEDQPGDLRFPEIWREEIEPTIKRESVFEDTFPEYWLFGPSISTEAELEKITEVSPELVRTINEIGSRVLRQFVSLTDEGVRFEESFYPYLDTRLNYYEDFSEEERAEIFDLRKSGGYSFTANALAISGNRRLRDRLTEDDETDTETEVYRSHMELVWDENTACYVLTWRSPIDGPLPLDLLEAVKNELEMSGGWVLSHESNSLLIHPIGEVRRDSEILDIMSNAVEGVYKLPGEQVIETNISYSL